MPALIRGVARTAVIAGTATATSNAVNRRMAQKNVEAYGNAQQQYQAEQGYAAPAVAVGAGPSPGAVVQPSAPAGGTDLTTELQKLADLKAQGILSDEEFAAAKAKLLGT
jgi:type II secretory pathway pseudopilin PulG